MTTSIGPSRQRWESLDGDVTVDTLDQLGNNRTWECNALH